MNELSLDNFATSITRDIKQVIEGEVKKIAQEALINALISTVYLKQKQYRQTRDLLGAVEVTDMIVTDSKATFSVIINASKLGIEIRHPELNAHASVGVNGKDFREPLIGVLDEGSSGSPIYNHQGYGFFDIAYQDMDANIIKVMASALRAKGYKVKMY